MNRGPKQSEQVERLVGAGRHDNVCSLSHGNKLHDLDCCTLACGRGDWPDGLRGDELECCSLLVVYLWNGRLEMKSVRLESCQVQRGG